jgi:hypothetical protein
MPFMSLRTAWLVAIFVAILAVSPASAGAAWSEPESLSERAMAGGPAIVVRGSRTWVAFAGGPDRPGIHVVTKVGDVVEVERVTTRPDFQPSIAVGPNAAVHIAFIRTFDPCDGPCVKGVYYATRRDGEWIVERVHLGVDSQPSIALGRDFGTDRRRPKIAFVNSEGGDYWRLWFARQQGEGWHAGRLLRRDSPKAGAPSLTFTNGDGVVAYIRARPEWRIEVLKFSDFFVTQTITGADDAGPPDITVDDEGRVHVAYVRRGDGLWYARWEFGSDVVRRRVADDARGDPAIALMPGGGVGIVVATDRGIIFRTNVTGDWEGSRVTTDPRDRFPDIDVTGGGRARVVFSHLDADGSREPFLSQASFPAP